MKTNLILLVLLSLFFAIRSEAQIRSYGFDVSLKHCDTLDEYYDILVNPDGSFYVVGMDSLNNSSSDEGHNAVLCKFNADYTLAWRKVYGGSKRDWFDKIKPYKEGAMLVAGSTSSNDGDVPYGYANTSWCTWVTIIDSAGNILHGNVWGYGNPTFCMDIVKTSDNKVFLTGSTVAFLGDFVGNTGPFLIDQYFVALADSQLNKKWLKLFINQESVAATKSVLLKNDTLLTTLATSSTTGDYNFGIPQGSWDVIWLYLDTNQNVVKKRRIGGSGFEGSFGMYSKDSSTIIALTSTNSLNGPFYSNEIPATSSASDWTAITKMNSDGQVIWNHLYGPFGTNITLPFTYGMLKLHATSNRFWTTGYIAGTDDGWVGPVSGKDTLGGSSDAFLWQHDTSGNLLRKIRMGEFHDEGFHFVGEMESGKYVVGLVATKRWLTSNNPFSCYPNKSSFKLYELKEWPVSTKDIQDGNEMELTVYPNPSSDKLTIHFSKNNNDKLEILIYNQNGSLMQKMTSRSERNDINTEALPAGVYIIKVVQNQRAFQSFFIKQ